MQHIIRGGSSIADPAAQLGSKAVIRRVRFWKPGAREAAPLATMDWMEADKEYRANIEPAKPARGSLLGASGITGGLHDALTSTSPTFVGYAQASTAGSSITPTVTYSGTANVSKSYSPATLLAGKK